MLKQVVIGTIIFSTLVLGKLNDYRNVFTGDTKEKIAEAIENFQDKTGNKLYLNTLEENEGFEAEEQEKAVIINLIKNNDSENGVLKVQLKISQDLNPEDISSDLSLLLTNVEEYVGEKDEGLVAINLVEGLQEVFITVSDSQEDSKDLEQMTLGTKVFLGILLTFLVLSIRIIQVKQKKRKYKLKNDRY
ncbi:hypothetical protein NON08_01540 [Cetobacterium somerae]|uniref:hypothetical protein n=1 Tax=Cetobacterium sp. NK01 TaxID=2993530 RepID=UPI002117235E|nr:hypothetical protein [Cetobacterium sp. NK01]MCQ8211251.1 hypothetical protein [Cetobacterium sp. NK01]